MKHSFFFLSSIVLLFSGCTSNVKTMNNSLKIDDQPQYQIPVKPLPPKKQAKGSLFSGQMNSLFTDRKQLQIGDIVYIIINEGSGSGVIQDVKGEDLTKTATSGDQRERGQETNTRKMSGGGITPDDKSPGLLKTIINGINGILGIGISYGDSTSKFKTDSMTLTKDILINDVSAVITQEFTNGNYLVYGEKNVQVKGQRLVIKLSAVMNPQDLNRKSEIMSNRLANLKVNLFKVGDDADLDERPWGTKILDSISPF